jgi:Zn-dependent protease with chaperone function
MYAFRLPFVILVALVSAAALAAPPDPASLETGTGLVFDRELASRKRDRGVDVDAATLRRVRLASSRLVAASVALDPAAANYRWSVHTFPDLRPDVIAYPGGRVLVSEGLVKATGFTDEEIAAVVAQALAHALLGHLARRIDVPEDAARAADPNRRIQNVVDRLPGVIAAPKLLPVEIEAADRASVDLLARAGLDPRAAGSAWRRLALVRGPLIERQPVTEARLDALDASVREALPAFEEARGRLAASEKPSPLPPIVGPAGSVPAPKRP